MVVQAADEPFNLGSLAPAGADESKVTLIDLSAHGRPRRFTAAQICSMIDGVSRGLLAKGLQRGDRVGIIAANCVEFVAAYFGAMGAGLVAVPINYRLATSTIEFIMDESGVSLVFCDPDRRALCPAGIPMVVFDGCDPESFDQFLDGGDFTPVLPAVDEIALLLYTSGSTGRPKGVMLSHSGYLWAIRSRTKAFDYSPHSFLVAAPLYHMNALNTIKLAMSGHGTLVLLPHFEARQYIDAIHDWRCTWLTAIPTMIALIAQNAELRRGRDLSCVTMVRLGSEPLTQRIIDSVAPIFPNASVGNGYGTTETGAVVFGPHPAGLRTPAMSLGYPHPEVQLRLVSGDELDAAEGVLEVKCPALMRGYYRAPELTAAAMTDDGFYRTGDVVRRDEDGFHYFVGRADDMFVCGGENVYPGEIEAMLERHPDIQQACVVPVDDDTKGKKPVALVVIRSDAQLTGQQVKDYALANGPAYQHPRAVYFVAALPVGGVDKIDRKAASRLVAACQATGPRP